MQLARRAPCYVRHTGDDWTEKRTHQLRVLFRQGWSDIRIAVELEVSLGAVIGKRQRLGLLRTKRRAVSL